MILLVAGVLAFLVARGLSRPITGLTGTMNKLSGGDTSVAIPGRERPDELGTMAKAVEVFRQNMIEGDRIRVVQTAAEKGAETLRKADMRRLAVEFEGAVGE